MRRTCPVSHQVVLLVGLILLLIANVQGAPFDELTEPPTAKPSATETVTDPAGDPPPTAIEPAPSLKYPAVAEAISAFQQGEIDACLAKLRIAVAQHPALPPPKLMLADFYLHAGQLSRARRLLEEVGGSGSQHPQLFLSLANLALTEGRLSDAWSHLQVMGELGVPENWTAEERDWFKRELIQGQVNVAERRENWQQAESLLAKWVTDQSQSPEVRARWARALFHIAKFDDAFHGFWSMFNQAMLVKVPRVGTFRLHSPGCDTV